MQVVLLKEELEKEVFYIEYLERLLADVARHKQTTINSSSSPDSSTSCSESLTQKTENSTSEVSSHKDISKLQDKCVNELGSALSSSKRPKSEIPKSIKKAQESSRRNSDPDVPSNYVTVIQVPGNSKKDSKKDQKNLEKTNEEGEEGDAEVSEEEPYYDSVPLDHNDEYVYIEPNAENIGSNGRKNSAYRPASLPESPGNQSNYVNIDYFIQ